MKIRTALTICAVAVAAAVVAPLAGAKGLEGARTDGVKTESLVLEIWEELAFKPEVEGIATGDGVDQEMCDAIASDIGDSIQDAIDAADANDVVAMEEHLAHAEELESFAGDVGCGIGYPV
jgi:hypothetical protein